MSMRHYGRTESSLSSILHRPFRHDGTRGTMPPRSLRALVFDAYGTLLDLHSAVALSPPLRPAKNAARSHLGRPKQLARTWQPSSVRRYDDFRRITQPGWLYP